MAILKEFSSYCCFFITLKGNIMICKDHLDTLLITRCRICPTSYQHRTPGQQLFANICKLCQHILTSPLSNVISNFNHQSGKGNKAEKNCCIYVILNTCMYSIYIMIGWFQPSPTCFCLYLGGNATGFCKMRHKCKQPKWQYVDIH